MAFFMRVPFMLVFHQSKCINATKRIFFHYRNVCMLVFFHVLVCSLLLRCIFKSSAVRVGVKTLYNTYSVARVKKVSSCLENLHSGWLMTKQRKSTRQTEVAAVQNLTASAFLTRRSLPEQPPDKGLRHGGDSGIDLANYDRRNRTRR